LIEVASQIKPQRMSEIMALMSTEAAERLTVEMATRSPADRTLNPANLPKIDGRPGASVAVRKLAKASRWAIARTSVLDAAFRLRVNAALNALF